jgi:hypothetical protein
MWDSRLSSVGVEGLLCWDERMNETSRSTDDAVGLAYFNDHHNIRYERSSSM